MWRSSNKQRLYPKIRIFYRRKKRKKFYRNMRRTRRDSESQEGPIGRNLWLQKKWIDKRRQLSWNGGEALLSQWTFNTWRHTFDSVRRLQDQENFLLTPFERNLEVWRQLWRVLERSHLVVQIVDARNPLRFRCEDLENYVQDVEGPEGEAGTGKNMRRSMLLINKADLLTAKQRYLWQLTGLNHLMNTFQSAMGRLLR